MLNVKFHRHALQFSATGLKGFERKQKEEK